MYVKNKGEDIFMISKKQLGHFKLHIIQAIKWTTMSFACLMTFSLGIFLGKQFSDSQKQSDTSLVQSLQNQNIPNVIAEDQNPQKVSMKLTEDTENNKKEISLVQDSKEAQERTLAGDTSQVQHPTEEHPTEKHPAEKHPTEEHSAEKHPTEEHPAEKHPAEKHPTEEHPTEEHPTEKHPAEKHPTEEHSAEKHPTEKHPTEKHPAEEHLTEEHSTEKHPTEAKAIGDLTNAPSPPPLQVDHKKSQEEQTKRQNKKSNTSVATISRLKKPPQNKTKQQELKNNEKGFSHHLPLNVVESLNAKYTIRLGIYDQERKAKAYVEELKGEGLNTFYMLLQRENKSWYRVSLGVYADKVVAKKELNRILRTTSIQTGSVEEILK